MFHGEVSLIFSQKNKIQSQSLWERTVRGSCTGLKIVLMSCLYRFPLLGDSDAYCLRPVILRFCSCKFHLRSGALLFFYDSYKGVVRCSSVFFLMISLRGCPVGKLASNNLKKISLAARGALAHCLQHCTACKIQNGCQGVWKGSPWGFLHSNQLFFSYY